MIPLQVQLDPVSTKPGEGQTSEKCYREVLRTWKSALTKYPNVSALREDFGVLRTGEQAFLARLDGDLYNIEAVRERSVADDLKDHVLQFMEQCMQNLCPGVVRWERAQSDAIEKLSERLFPSDAGPVTHIVLVDADGSLCAASTENETVDSSEMSEVNDQHRAEELKCLVDALAGRFRQKMEELAIQDLRVLDRATAVLAFDGVYQGALHVDRRYDVGLIVTFEDADALGRYYKHSLHSEERRALYCWLNPAAESLYLKADSLGALKYREGEQRHVFEEIEEAMKPWVLRVDLYEDFSGPRLLARGPGGLC